MHVKQILTSHSMVSTRVATLNGTLLDDRGEACDCRFQWGLTTAYGNDTAWQPGLRTSDTFSEVISNLNRGATYHYRAQARNSVGTSSGLDVTFFTS